MRSRLVISLSVTALGGAALANQPPRINQIAVTPTPSAGGQMVHVTTTAVDPEGQALTHLYSTAQGSLAGAADQDPEVDWTLPAGEGQFLLSLEVRDPLGGVARAERRLSVGPVHEELTLTGALRQPVRVAVGASGDLWVTDAARARVVHLGADGSALGEIATAPRPLGLAFLDANTLLVGEDSLDRVGRYATNGAFQGAFAGDVQMPNAIAITPGGTVHVVDSHAALVRTFAGDGTPGPTYGGGTLQFPVDLCIRSDGAEVFVADQSSAQVRVFDGSGALLRSLGSRGAGAGQFMRLGGVALDSGSRLLTLDTFLGRIQLLEPDGTHVATFGHFGDWGGGLHTPLGLGALPGQRVFATSGRPAEIEVFAHWVSALAHGLVLQ